MVVVTTFIHESDHEQTAGTTSPEKCQTKHIIKLLTYRFHTIGIQEKITHILQIVFITQMFWFAPLQKKLRKFFDHYLPE
jgi:hypothetical protein